MALHAEIFQTMIQKKIKLTYKDVFLTLLIFVSILLPNFQLIEVDIHDIWCILIPNLALYLLVFAQAAFRSVLLVWLKVTPLFKV